MLRGRATWRSGFGRRRSSRVRKDFSNEILFMSPPHMIDLTDPRRSAHIFRCMPHNIMDTWTTDNCASRVDASMHPCMNSSTWHKPRLSDINIRSVITIQVTDLSGKAAVKMQPLISPLCHQSESCRMMALWPLDHETSDVIARDWDRNSKIRRHCPMRLDEAYTAHAVPMALRESAASVRGGPD